MKPTLILFLSVFALNTTTVLADAGSTPGSIISNAAGGMVEAMQMPAWYERDGKTYPLKPGIRVYSGDVIRTGNNSRALLRMNEGSTVKLGADAKLSLNTLAPPKQKEGVFAALMRVTRGAFRFTTTALGENRKRNVDVRIGSVTIGIRGTDIWGRSKTDGDLFCLIEGKVNVQRDGENAFSMQDPLQYIVAEKNKPTSAAMPVDMNELSDWAAETETQQGQGILSTSGRWAVNMMSLQNTSTAVKLQQALHDAGFAAEIQEVEINGQNWLRIRVEGFVSRQDASSFSSIINSRFGIQQPWIVKF